MRREWALRTKDQQEHKAHDGTNLLTHLLFSDLRPLVYLVVLYLPGCSQCIAKFPCCNAALIGTLFKLLIRHDSQSVPSFSTIGYPHVCLFYFSSLFFFLLFFH